MSNQKVKLKTGEIGTVKESFLNMQGKKYLIIELSGGELVKRFEDDIEYVKEETEDKDEVTISAKYFASLVARKAVIASKGDFSMGLLFSFFGALLASEIFGEKADHD